jgi:hypothetical protein
VWFDNGSIGSLWSRVGLFYGGSVSGQFFSSSCASQECKKVSDRRTYTEVVGLSQNPVEDYFNSFSEPIARVPKWLKDALVELEVQARESEKYALSCKNAHFPARFGKGLMVESKKSLAPTKGI